MTTVFISHASMDAEFIEREIIPLLQSRHLKVWYSAKSIQTAEEWESAIKRGLESSDWFLVALSAEAAKSKWLKAEVSWAFAHREGKIVPVLIDTVDPFDIHIRLNDIQYADFRRDRRKGAKHLLDIFDRPRSPPQDKRPAKGQSDSSNSSNNFPLKALAAVQMQRGNYDAAITELEGALELDPADAGALVLRGTCLLAKLDWDAAISDLTSALAGNLNPLARSTAYQYRARAYASKHNDAGAIADCNEALRVDPNNADAYLLRGKMHRKKLERDLAISDFTESLRLNPKSAESYLQRAIVRREISDITRAKLDYAEAVNIDPSVIAEVPSHFRDPGPLTSQASRTEEALSSLRAISFVGMMDNMDPTAKVTALNELAAIGIPKVMADLDYLLENLPKDAPEYEVAILINRVAKDAGLKK